MKLCIILATILCSTPAFAADWKPAPWKPAPSPLMTRFAKDVHPDNVLSEYPRPQMVRKRWQNLNGLWQFAMGDDVKETPIGKDLSGQILVPFCVESSLSGVGKQAQKLWYRRTFEIPADWSGSHMLLHFGAVDYESTVYINGKQVGTHRGGYDAFSFDITDALKKSGPQELIVEVSDATSDSQPRGKQLQKPVGIWYTPCTGIWQTVWIEPVPEHYIRSVRVETSIDPKNVTFHVDAPDAQGNEFHFTAEVDTEDKMPPMYSSSPGMGFNLKAAKLWSPEEPNLYSAKLAIWKDKEKIDEITTYFGIRKIEVSPDEKGIPRVKLNGKPILMVGPLDQGFWPDGIYTAPTDDALKSDIEMEKKLGFNCLRKHVKVEPQRFYYWCDKLGILVWQDMPSTFLNASDPAAQKQFETELTALVEQHINSPAIVTWVPLNEGWGQAAWGHDGTIHLVDLIKKIDPSRLVDDASGWTDAGAGDMHDIHSYPGPAAPSVEKNRAIVLGEFGGLGLGVDHHTWSDKNWGYAGMASQQELTDRYERLLGRFWQLAEQQGLCAGIYTQITDVETECNGLMTYDREVLKVDADRVRQANLGKGPRVGIVPLVPTAAEQPADWKYTFDKPADNWQRPGFDDSTWKTGQSGFGTDGTPGAHVHTVWNTSDIWLRREIAIPADAVNDAELYLHHDEACEVYINGVRAGSLKGFTTDYEEHQLNGKARAALKPGKNLIAAHCNQTTGGQYFDLGFVRLIEQRTEAADKK